MSNHDDKTVAPPQHGAKKKTPARAHFQALAPEFTCDRLLHGRAGPSAAVKAATPTVFGSSQLLCQILIIHHFRF